MTRPRIPASEMTRSLPRPSTKCGRPRVRAKRTRARSSWALWTVANRSAGPADAHRREAGERFVARCLDPDPALDVGPGGDRIEAGDHRSPPRARRSISAGSGNGRRVAAAMTSSATAAAAPGRPSAAGGGRHRGVRPRVLEQPGRVEERRGVEVLVRDQPGRARHRRGSRRSPAGARPRADTARRPSAGPSRSPRPGWTIRPARRPGPRWPARPASRRAGTGTGGSGGGPRPGRDSRPASAAA